MVPIFSYPFSQKVLGCRVLFFRVLKRWFGVFFFIKKYEREKKTLLLVA